MLPVHESQLCFLAFTMIVLTTFSAAGGFTFISDSNVKRHEVPCKLLEILAFSCDFSSSINQYHSATSMILQLNNNNVTITMADNCISCFDCKNLYNLGTTFNCALTNNKYTIFDSNHTTNYALVILGVVFLLFSTAFFTAFIITIINLNSSWVSCVLEDTPYSDL